MTCWHWCLLPSGEDCEIPQSTATILTIAIIQRLCLCVCVSVVVCAYVCLCANSLSVHVRVQYVCRGEGFLVCEYVYSKRNVRLFQNETHDLSDLICHLQTCTWLDLWLGSLWPEINIPVYTSKHFKSLARVWDMVQQACLCKFWIHHHIYLVAVRLCVVFEKGNWIKVDMGTHSTV